jgi:hypothetical protein
MSPTFPSPAIIPSPARLEEENLCPVCLEPLQALAVSLNTPAALSPPTSSQLSVDALRPLPENDSKSPDLSGKLLQSNVHLHSHAVSTASMSSQSEPLVSIFCNHMFHLRCLTGWAQDDCPVCRFNIRPMAISRCSVCQCEQNNWICLICGYIGCGRYRDAHAMDHFTDTGHAFAMNIETQRVWDYVNDNFVHRLIRSNDGELVDIGFVDIEDELADHFKAETELNNNNDTSFNVGSVDSDLQNDMSAHSQQSPLQACQAIDSACSTSTAHSNLLLEKSKNNASVAIKSQFHTSHSSLLPILSAGKGKSHKHESRAEETALKMEAIVLEYSHVLSSQLDQQRRHFLHICNSLEERNQQRISELERKCNAGKQTLDNKQESVSKVEAQILELKLQAVQSDHALDSLTKLNKDLKRLHETLTARRALQQKQKEARIRMKEEMLMQKIAKQDSTIEELHSEINDMMFFINTQKRYCVCSSFKSNRMIILVCKSLILSCIFV